MSKRRKNRAKVTKTVNSTPPTRAPQKTYNSHFGCGFDERNLGLRGQRNFNNFLGRYIQLARENWLAAQAIGIPVEDILRNGWSYTNLDKEQTDLIEDEEKKLKLFDNIKNALLSERTLGGAALLMVTADGGENLEAPLIPETIDTGGLLRLNLIPRTLIIRADFNQNPFSINFGEPEFFWIQGQKIHASRLLLFKGLNVGLLQSPQALMELNNYLRDGFGDSVLMKLESAIHLATRTMWSGLDIAERAAVLVFSGDLSAYQETDAGGAQLSGLETVVNQINTHKAAVLDSSPGNENKLSTLSASFAGFPELIKTYVQLVGAALGIPGSKFLGEGQAGLSSSGDPDLEQYYTGIKFHQLNNLKPQLEKLIPVLFRSALGSSFDTKKIDVTFDPLQLQSKAEEATIFATINNTLTTMATSGLITAKQAIAQAIEKETFSEDIADDPSLQEPEETQADQQSIDKTAALLKSLTSESVKTQPDDKKGVEDQEKA